MGGADIAEVADPHSYATLFGLWGNFANPPAPRLPTVTWSSGTNGAAGVYVFTTPNYPVLGSKKNDTLTPIFRMRKLTPVPNASSVTDHSIAVGEADLARLDELGYQYLGRMGYILPQCSSEPFLLAGLPVPLVRRCTAENGETPGHPVFAKKILG